jgi:hypothetical protein
VGVVDTEFVGVVAVAVVELVSSPGGRLAVEVGATVGVAADSVLVAVWISVGTSNGPFPDGATTRVATIVECVLGSALDTPTHML